MFFTLLLDDKPFNSHHFSAAWQCTSAEAGQAVTPADLRNEGGLFVQQETHEGTQDVAIP